METKEEQNRRDKMEHRWCGEGGVESDLESAARVRDAALFQWGLSAARVRREGRRFEAAIREASKKEDEIHLRKSKYWDTPRCTRCKAKIDLEASPSHLCGDCEDSLRGNR